MSQKDTAQEATVIEHASALARAGSADQAVTILREYANAHPRAAIFLLNAGKALQDAGAPHLAVPFLEESFADRRTPQAADRLFVCYHRLGRMDDAVRALAVLAAGGNYRGALRRDFAGAIRRVSPGTIDVPVLQALAKAFVDDIVVAPSLLLHLIAAGQSDVVIRIAGNGAVDASGWDEDMVLQAADHLQSNGRDDLAMRVMCRCGGHSDVFLRRLTKMLDRHSPTQLRTNVLPLLKAEEGRISTLINPEPYFEIATRFAQAGDGAAALETLSRLADSLDRTVADRAYARQRQQISEIVRLLVERGQHDRAVSFALSWIDPTLRRFFAGPDVQRMLTQLEAAHVRRAAAPASRLGVLREGYFRHHMERREGITVPPLPSDAQLRAAAFKYFQTVSHSLGTDAIPVSSELRDGLPLGAAMDAWSYLQNTVVEKSIPSGCIPVALLEEFRAVTTRHTIPGVNVTKFAERFLESNDVLRTTLDPATALDSLFLLLHLVVGPLARNTQYLPFIAPMVPPRGSPEYAFMERCLATLTAESPDLEIGGEDVLAALTGSEVVQPRPAIVRDAPQDVLLVGHASKSTGLGRNFRMLAGALGTGPARGITMQELDYESDVREIGRRLSEWRRSCRTRPIVVYAVNAHDVPAIFLKDGKGDLADAYAAGFFLWETSRPPGVQRLGIALIDEIWAPTRYVHDIYAPLAPTHLIGKGLFESSAGAPTANERRAPNSPFRFVTIFDFDSSIERKNPLAVVQAFQKAFTAGEKVELIVKGSSINAAHWSNALGHWERLSDAMAGDARIRLVTERYSDAEMEALLRDADCFVSLHRAEGFGYVIADAMAFGVPVIVTDYSGNADFCTPETSFPVASPLIPVDPRATQWPAEGAEWADPGVDAAAARMREVHADYPRALQIAHTGRAELHLRYGMEAFRKAITDRIAAIRATC